MRGSAWRGSPEQPVFQGWGGWEEEPGCRGCCSKGSEAWGTGEPSSSLVRRTLGAWKSLLLLWGQASRWPFPAGSIVDRTQSHLWSAGWDPGHSPTHMHPATELPAPPWQPRRSAVLGGQLLRQFCHLQGTCMQGKLLVSGTGSFKSSVMLPKP